ncbi:hypothetical protein DPMN_045991 [Dreissena polymorpha]|uniref:Uncharacterized protein n=1 Tax=Dreissena polymorpha TaxID=45954 RepID=A0A9D4D7A6_DREPO|nr:hypothetical protein DPMN_045991 [Dreissena polymorpha]
MIFIFKRVQCTLANETLMFPLPYGDDEVWIPRSVPHTTNVQDTQHDPHPIITRRICALIDYCGACTSFYTYHIHSFLSIVGVKVGLKANFLSECCIAN